MAPKPIDCPFVFVRWTDASTDHGWVGEEEDDSATEEVWSCGWMLANTRAEVRLASDVGAEGDSRNRRIAIPRGMVLEIRQGSMDGPQLYRKAARGKAPQAAEPPAQPSRS